MEIVKIVNKWDRDIRLENDEHGTLYIPQGKEVICNLDYVAVAFGHPSAVNEGKRRTRDDAYKATRVFWGYYDGMEPEHCWSPGGPDNDGVFQQKMPNIEVWTVGEDPQRIWTVMEDPQGFKGGASGAGTLNVDVRSTSDAVLAAKVEEMQAQIATLTALLTSKVNDKAVVSDDEAADLKGAALQAAAQAFSTQDAINEGAIPVAPDGSEVAEPDAPRTTRTGRKG